MTRPSKILAVSALAVAIVAPAAALADYPADKPIRMVIGYAAGGAADKLARPIAEKVSKIIGQSIVMDYRPGAGGAIALDVVARTPPDGYTIHLTDSGPATILPNLRKTSYDPLKDFAPIAMVGSGGTVIVALPDSPAKDVKTFIELAKKDPAAWSYGTSGIGGVAHLSAEQLKSVTGMTITHVPYKGGAPALVELLGGHIPVLFSSMGSASAHLEAGRVRGLAVTSIKRAKMLPNVPTLAESGYPGFDAQIWFGFVGPAGLPDNVMKVLVPAFNEAMKDPDIVRMIENEGYDPLNLTPAQMHDKIKSDLVQWAKVIKEAKVTLD
ncbi:MAG: tripartite tricarboxylate transporter substrate binding protein [Burkholderiaceae bacterium]|nr:tripartite tricarboxylate transporter substrate binding protein [Burkholderiaceae bacterium]